MSDIEAIASKARGLRQLRFLVALMELIDETPGLVEVWRDGILERAGEPGLDYQVWAEDARAMDRNGWVRFEESIAGIDSLRLTQHGRDTAAEFANLRESPWDRTRHTAEASLKWLHGLELREQTAQQFDDFLATPGGAYLGASLTQTELKRAWEHLADKGLVRGTKTMQGPVLRPSITPAGSMLVEAGRSVYDSDSGSGSVTHINAQGAHGFNMAVNSPYATQTNTLTTEQVNHVKQTVDALRGVLANFGVPENVKAEAEIVLEEIEEEAATQTPRSGKIRERLTAVGAAIGQAGLAVVTTTANALIQHAMQGM